MMKRRDFLRLPSGLLAFSALPRVFAQAPLADPYLRKAMWWKFLPDGRVLCQLCPNQCKVDPGKAGDCRVRVHQAGSYYTRVYGRPVTIHNDPIEKKPLFHFLPGTNSLSISNGGCNMACQFCQNWQLAQNGPDQLPARYGFVSPEKLLLLAHRQGSRSVAFTYSEPIVFYEYAYQIAKLGLEQTIPGVMISNGYIEPQPLDKLLGVLGAYKVDFKAFDDEFYKKVCHGRLKPVLESMKRIKASGVWMEIVHLTIPRLNDSSDQLKRLCHWILENVGPDVPVHFSRFHPTYMLKNLPRTPVSAIERAWRIAKQAGIHYAYVGNLAGHEAENTYCHHCNSLLIKRMGYVIEKNLLKNGSCPQCLKKIPGVFSWPRV